MGFSIYWIVAVSLKLLYTAGTTAKVTRTHALNTTVGCSLGNQSLPKCGVHAATKKRLKIHRRQIYSTPAGFTFPNVANSYELDMGYSPNVGFEPYWPGTKMEGTTRRDYKVCGVICPSMYINYGPLCGINKNLEYKSFLSYCDMRNEDCMNMAHWRAIYKGPCNKDTKDVTTTTTTKNYYAFWFIKIYKTTRHVNDINDADADALVRTYPTKSADIKRHISYYMTQFLKRTPTTPEPGVMEDLRKYGPRKLDDSYQDPARHSRGGNSKHEGNTVSKKSRRHSHGDLHGYVHLGSGRRHRRREGPNKSSGASGQSLEGPGRLLQS